MANSPHPSRQAVTWRLQRDLITNVKATAARRGETVLSLVDRALRHELAQHEEQPEENAVANTDACEWGASCALCGRTFERDTRGEALSAAQSCAENDRRGSDYWDDK